jgi:hypothetical protein
MKLLIGICVVVLLAACGKKGQEDHPWPASVSLSSLSETQRVKVRETIAKLNTSLGEEALREDDPELPYQISISAVEAPDGDSRKAGIAIIAEESCSVQLSLLLFDDKLKGSYLTEVTWHELGHCAGLDHDPNEGELMYATTTPANELSSGAMQRFFKAFLNSAGL